MQNELQKPHSVIKCFLLAFRLYRTNFIPITILFGVLLAPAILSELIGLPEMVQSIIFLLISSLAEAATTLGVIALIFQPVFPSIGIIKNTKLPLIVGSLFIGLLQLLTSTTGIFSLQGAYPLLNLILFAVLIISIFAFSLAQMVFIVEGVAGVRAMLRSFQLFHSNIPKVIITITLLGGFKLIISSIFVLFYFPMNELAAAGQASEMQQLQTIFQNSNILLALKRMQYFAYLALSPFSTLVMILLFFDLRQVTSSLDITHLQSKVAYLLSNPDEEPISNDSPAIESPEISETEDHPEDKLSKSNEEQLS